MMKFFVLLLFFPVITYSKIDLTLVKDVKQIVWGIEFEGDTLLLTERRGKLKVLNLKTKKLTEIQGVPEVYAKGQGGLLDIKKHPDFENNKRIYLSYSKTVGKNKTTALGYGILKNNKLENFKDIFVAKGEATKRLHFGSRISFDENNKIFLSIGERGERKNAQNLKNHFGTIIRINDDGSVPKDNPFLSDKKALPEIWSYGHRNPQGLFYDKATSTLYEMEHGPRGGDEINIIKKGANYGWPVISYGKEYWGPFSVGESTKKKGMEQPIKYYIPSIAPSGLVLYTGDKYPDLKNKLISGALALTHINIFDPKTKKEMRLFEDKAMRMRAVAVSPNQEIYVSSDNGHIYKLTNTSNSVSYDETIYSKKRYASKLGI